MVRKEEKIMVRKEEEVKMKEEVQLRCAIGTDATKEKERRKEERKL